MAAYTRAFMNIAHRGASGYCPENTLASFRLAMEQGIATIELDVRLTRDRQVAVIHDRMVDRTTDGQGLVADHTLSELKRLDAGAWFDEEYRGETIPTLAEVLEVLGPETGLVVEIKDGFYFPEIVDKVVSLVRARRLEDRVGISAFHWHVLRRVKEICPVLRTSALLKYSREAPWSRMVDGMETRIYASAGEILAGLSLDMAETVCPPADAVTAEMVEALHVAGYRVRAWGLKKAPDEDEMIRLIDCGVDGMTTNYPDLLARILRPSPLAPPP